MPPRWVWTLLLLTGVGAPLHVAGAVHTGHAAHGWGVAPASGDSATIEGMVVDGATGRPLPGTLVRVVGIGRQDVTHEDGTFHLLNVPAGWHTVLFERLGYRREVRSVEVTPLHRLELNVEMRPSAIELPGIVVTGSPQPILGEQAVRPATVLSGQDLARRMDVSLAATLQAQPGMAATSVGPATGRPVIRGLGGDRVLVLEDGARVGDLSSSSPDHALSVEPLNAERIEVVRGPTALMYGSNAIGGVINVIRDEVPSALPHRPAGTLTLQGQSANVGVGAGGSGQLGLGSMVLRGEGSYRSAGDLRTPHGVLENTGLRTFSLAAGAAHVGDDGHVGAAYRYYDNAYGIPGGFVGSHPFGVDVEMRRHSVQAQAHLRRRLGPYSSVDVHANYSNYYHRELEAADIIGTEFGLLSAAGELVARHAGRGLRSSGALGTRIAWQDFQAAGMETPPTHEVAAALFAIEELGAGRVRVQGGVRLDWHRITPRPTQGVPLGPTDQVRSFASVSASLGALYQLAPWLSTGASLARAYRTPDTAELFSRGPHLAAYSYEVGNPGLQAEVGHGLDAFVRLAGERVTGEVTLFRNALDNYIYYRDTGEREPETQLPIWRATGTDAVLDGFEVAGSAEILRYLVVSGVASYVRGTRAADDAPLPLIPPLHGQVGARYDRPSYFAGLAWRGAAAQERVATDEFEPATPGYAVLDLEAGLRWVALGRVQSVTVRVENATNDVVYDHMSRIRERDTGSGGERRAPGPGRGVSMVYRMVF
jgi:iron complex outermembrane recepter protein